MPNIDMSIISGNIMNSGLLRMLRPPVANMSASMPMTATIITTGSNFINRFPGTTRGTSGGAAMVNSPPGARGTAMRARRTNPSVVETNSSPHRTRTHTASLGFQTC